MPDDQREWFRRDHLPSCDRSCTDHSTLFMIPASSARTYQKLADQTCRTNRDQAVSPPVTSIGEITRRDPHVCGLRLAPCDRSMRGETTTARDRPRSRVAVSLWLVGVALAFLGTLQTYLRTTVCPPEKPRRRLIHRGGEQTRSFQSPRRDQARDHTLQVGYDTGQLGREIKMIGIPAPVVIFADLIN